MMMVVVMVMMMVVMHRMLHRSGRRRGGFLRDGVAGEADGQHGGGDKALDHGIAFLWLNEPRGSMREL